MRRKIALAGLALVLAANDSLPADCPTRVDAARFASADRLWDLNTHLASYGPRPTASPSHQQYLDWLAGEMAAIPGAQSRSLPYTIDRWLPGEIALEAGGASVPVSGPVPYAKPTAPDGVSGELVYVPAGQAIAGAAVSGKIVVRDAATGSVPNAAFAALQWFSYDPDLTLTQSITGNYERDFLAYQSRITDLQDAGSAGAAGLVLVHSFPREQVAGHYAPYEGLRWPVPALYVGADEGAQLKQLAAAGGSATIRLATVEGPADTRTLITTLTGLSTERIVIESHTDGMNALWDNGPIVMIEMARYFGALGEACRPRTIELVFTTGHLYQRLVPPKRDGGAEQYATELDHDYDEGTVAMVLALEHFGAREYAAVPRTDGPGRRMTLTGRSEPNAILISESPVLVATVAAVVAANDLQRTIALRGADLPGARIPPHRSLGGEGGPYHTHMIPTAAFITAPWPLYNPAFGMEILDKDLMYRQSLTFTDLVHAVATIPREALAGAFLVERPLRDAICESPLADAGVAECE